MDHNSLHARNTHEFPAGAHLISLQPLKLPGKPQRDVTGNSCACHRQHGSPKAWPPAAILFLFPPDWTEDMIERAGKFVINHKLAEFRKAADGEAVFDNFNGVRVIKTNGKPATIFPDAAKQPIPNSTKFEKTHFKRVP